MLPAAALAARGNFDGLYGQDPYAYYDYAVGPLRQALGQFRPPPPFYWPPGYPLPVALVSLLVGARPLAGQLISLVAGGLAAVFTTLLAGEVWLALPRRDRRSRLDGPIAGPLLAGVLLACCGQLWQSGMVVMSDTLALACATAGVWALARYGRGGGGGWLALAAGALAWALLTRWAAAVIIVPCAAYAATVLPRRWRQAPRATAGQVARALLLAAAIVGPPAAAGVAGLRQPPPGDTPAAANVQVDRWHPLNALRHEFRTADGRLLFDQPNGVYYAGLLAAPVFFTPLLAWLLAPGGWRLLRRPAPLPLCLVAGWLAAGLLFYCGLPWQNIRYALAYAPPAAILIAVGVAAVAGVAGRRGAPVVALGLIAGLAWMAAGGVGLAERFIARKEAELALVRAVAAPPDARLLTFGPTLAFRHYAGFETRDLSEQGADDLARLLADGRPLLLLLDVPNIEGQWRGRAPERNLRWLRDGPGLTERGRYGAYTLYQVGAGR